MKNNNYKKENPGKLKQTYLFLLLFMLSLATFNPAKAVVGSYSFSSTAGTFTSISGTVLFPGGWDDLSSAPLLIPFTFVYNNISYTTVGVNSNGFITLGNVPGTVYCGLQASLPNSIAGYGTDLISSQSVNYTTSGTAPNRQFIVQWNDCNHWGGAGTDHWTFQIILNETINSIQVVWGPVTQVTTMGPNGCADIATESGDCGLLGGTVADFNIRSITNGIETWATSSAGAALNAVCNMSSTNFPANGLTYTWTPPVPAPMVYDSSTTIFVNNLAGVAKASAGNQILKVKVMTSGNLAPFNVSSIDFTTGNSTNPGTDIANAKIYFTGLTNSFSTAVQYGSTVANPNGAFTVSGSATLEEGANYFWLAYDVSGNAIIADTLSACCTQITGSGTMGVQIPSVTCPSGYQTIIEIGFWTPVATQAPHGNLGEMVLLTDGTVLCKSSFGVDNIGNTWDRLTPDINGSYINGTWSSIAPMFNTRLYYSTQILMDGRMYVAGGEYGTGNAQGEVYDPLTNTWTMTPSQGNSFSDANSEILPDGRVLQALVSFTFNLRGTMLWDPIANTYTLGPQCLGSHNESVWLKLPDSSIIMVDIGSTNSERYIPSLNQWIADATVPVDLYDPFGSETGAALMLPDGRGFFLGSLGHTAYYTPSGSVSPGTWIAGPDIPNGKGTPDAAAAMMVNGVILCAVSPAPVSGNVFQSPTSFYEFDYISNTFTQIFAPAGGLTQNEPCYVSGMLNLPDGSVMYGHFDTTQYYIYHPIGAPLAAGKPTVNNVVQYGCNLFTAYGTLFNGISEGQCYGDDWQNATNYPIIRLASQSNSNVYYARTFNWNSTGLMRGNLPDTTQFTLPAGLPADTYWLTVIANGISSDSLAFTPFAVLSSTLTPPDVCSGALFTYTPTSAATGATFTWTRAAVAGISNPAVTIPQTTDPSEILINITTSPIPVVYLYTITANNCSATQNVTVMVVPDLIDVTGTTTICHGDSTTLTAVGGNGFLWSNGATTASITVNPVNNTTYYVTITNTNGCAGGLDSIEVTVHSLPVVNFTGLPASVCATAGDITLTGTPTGGTFSGFGMSGNIFNPATLSGNDTILYTYTDSSGCTGK
ncbi:MAG: BNR-repeat neuraminidase N-terminal domain-containing protein, partial [Bacteroidota bacterium]